MNDKKVNLESICKELGLDLNGDVFVAINNVNLTAAYVYIDATQGIINVIPQDHINKEVSIIEKGGER